MIVPAVLAVLMALLVPVLAGPARPVAAATPSSSTGSGPGYWLIASDGGVYQFGTTNYGGMRGTPLNRPIVGGAPTNNGQGYWMVASDGGIFSFGNAHFHGSTGGITLNKPIVGMAADSATGGYWMVASDGGIFAFDAPFHGSTGGITLNKPVVGMAPTPDGGGYWMVASDGGVFAFGDAHFYGSTGGITLNKPIVGISATPDGGGYWMVASDGGVFAFGDAHFYGSTGGVALNAPVVAINSSGDGRGYWMAARDGGIFTFGDAPMLGSAASAGSPAPIVAMMSTAKGYPFPPGGYGNDVSNYSCGNGGIPSHSVAVPIVEVGGWTDAQAANPPSCLKQEFAWAGANLSAYFYMTGLPNPAPPESMSGPAGTCNGSAACESYNFGYYWARYWVDYARQEGRNPDLWWVDVESFAGAWDTSAAAQPANQKAILGAVAGLRSMGVEAGLYGFASDWATITGSASSPYLPGIPLWVADFNGISEAQQVCSGSYPGRAPFAGGNVVVVQYAQQNSVDYDYACP